MKDNIIDFVQLVKELNYVLNKKQKIQAVFVFLVVCMSSLFELLGVAMILPFIQVILTPEIVMERSIVAWIMERLEISSNVALLELIGIALILLYLFKNMFLIGAAFIQNDYASRIQKQLSVEMLNSYINRPYQFFLNTNSAIILRGCSSDVAGVYKIISSLLSMLAEVLSIIMIGSYLLYEEPMIAIGTLAIMVVVLFGIVAMFKPIIKRIGVKTREVAVIKNKSIYQAVNGVKEILVMQRMSYFTREYETASEQSRKMQRTYETIVSCPNRIIEGVCVSAIIGLVCIRLAIPGTDKAALVPILGAFAMAAFKIFPSIGKITNQITNIMFHRPGLKGVYNNIKAASVYSDERKQYIECSKIKSGEMSTRIFNNKLTINHVYWKYKDQETPVLNDVCVEITKGQSVAFIGTSGSGKTTLSDIILGLLRPQKGQILMDGIDVYSMPTEWANVVGYVPQSIFLVDDTVRNNVTFGTPKELVVDEKIWDALEHAQIKDFIQQLPQGLDTVVGERGIKFSGGQKQRLAIARALYNTPQILVLDEATAALDNDTENAVMGAIESLRGQITMIIVAHRLTTIRNCDKIYKIDNGVAEEVSKKVIFE